MEIIFDILFPAIGAFLEILLQSLLDFVHREKIGNSIYSYIFIFFLGASLGLLSTVIYPHQIIPVYPIQGISLVLAPLITGVIMYFFGRWRISKGHKITSFATFPGGALFAFSFALVRFLMIIFIKW